MFSCRETPRHSLGVVLEHRPRSREAAIAAVGLDWRILHGPDQRLTPPSPQRRAFHSAAHTPAVAASRLQLDRQTHAAPQPPGLT